MAGLYEKPSETYAKKRPQYPKEWFSMLAGLTAGHQRAWDAGCGTGQAAISMAEHYESVVATDVSEGQLRHAIAHPKVRYFHTPEHLTEDELVSLVGGEGSLDLVVVATSIHWFDIPLFYAVVNRALRKPGGVLAVWGLQLRDPPVRGRAARPALPGAAAVPGPAGGAGHGAVPAPAVPVRARRGGRRGRAGRRGHRGGDDAGGPGRVPQHRLRRDHGEGQGRGPGGGHEGRAEACGGGVGRPAHRAQEARVQGVHARREAQVLKLTMQAGRSADSPQVAALAATCICGFGGCTLLQVPLTASSQQALQERANKHAGAGLAGNSQQGSRSPH